MKKLFSLAALLLFVSSAHAIPEADEAAQLAADGKFIKFEKKNSAVPFFLYDLSAPRPGKPFSGYFIAKSPMQLKIIRANGKHEQISIGAYPQKISRSANKKLNLPKRNINVANSFLEFDGLPLKRLYIRPNLEKIADEALVKLKPENFPDASQTLIHMRMVAEKDGTDIYLNGSYAGRLEGSPIAAMQLMLRSSAEVLDLSRQEKETPVFEMLNLDLRSRSELPAALSLAPETEKEGVPFRKDISHALDLRNAVALSMKTGYTQNQDRSRSAFDGLPSSYLFSVPAQQYSRAYILCSPIPSQGALPVFRLVMTRYAPYGRADLAIPSVEVDLSIPSKNIRKCGSATLTLEGGKKTSVPVYLVEVPLDHGAIQDIIYDDPHAVLPFRDYLDIDLQGPGKRIMDAKDRAAIAVYAITLEKTPVNMLVRQAEKGNIFHTGEKAVIPVELAANKAGKYTLSWNFHDMEKKKISSGSEIVTLEKGDSKTIMVPVNAKTPGWFGAEIALSSEGKFFSTYKAASVILPKDTRTLKNTESPYSVWFFGSSHYLPTDTSTFGPILQKAGIRAIGCSMEHPESDWEKWGISLCQFRNIMGDIYTDARILSDDPAEWEKMENDLKRGIAQYVKRFPRCKRILLFHESFQGDYAPLPLSIVGKKPVKFDEKREKLERARVKAATEFCKIVRRDFPQLKIVYGNSCWAQGMIESLAVRGFDPAFVDYIGCEAVGAWLDSPESFSTWNPAGSSYMLRETARLAGFDKPITATFEWSCRSSNMNELGPSDPHDQMLRQAQWMIRDIITAYTYGYDNIPVSGGLTDTGTIYNNGRTYGALGLLTRKLAPKPVYAAVATATRILDNVRFTHAVKGPSDVYLFAFRRTDGNNIYALWTSKGKAECSIDIGGNEKEIASEDIFGRPSEFTVEKGKIKAEATESIRYFITKNTFTSFQTLSRSFDTLPEPKNPLAKLDVAAGDLVQDSKPDERVEGREFNARTFQAEYRVPAAVSEADDPEKGKCVSVKFDLSKIPNDSWNHGGYAMLRFKKPVDIPPDADGIGMWVKGNGSLGRLAWEIEDANGNSFISNGAPNDGAGNLVKAYENEFDFTEWRFLYMALTPALAKPAEWFSLQWHGMKKSSMKPPFKLTGILLSTSQKFPHIFEFLPVKNQEILFEKIVFFCSPYPRPLTMAATNIPEKKDDGANMIENGGFERLAPPSPKQVPENWKVASAEFPVFWVLHPTAQKVSGTASVVIKDPASGKNAFRVEGMYVGFRQDLQQSGAAAAKLKVSLKARGTGLVCITLLYKGGKSATLRFHPKADEWKEFSGILDSPANAVSKVLFIQQGASKGYIEVDDIHVEGVNTH